MQARDTKFMFPHSHEVTEGISGQSLIPDTAFKPLTFHLLAILSNYGMCTWIPYLRTF